MKPKTLSTIARATARATRSATYTGQPCQHGHLIRYTANALCVACALARRAEQTAQEKDSRYA